MSGLLGLAPIPPIAAETVGTEKGPAYPSIEGLKDVQSIDMATEGTTIHALLAGRVGTNEHAVALYTASRNGGLSWARPVMLNRRGDHPLLSKRGNDVRLAVSGRHLVAVWQQQGELPGAGPLVVAYSGNGGRDWSRADNPARGDALRNQSYADLAVDGAGEFHLVWLDDREENGNTQGLRYARSTDRGRHWRQETTVDLDVCTCCWNRLITFPDRAVSVLYRGNEPHDMRLAQRNPERGVWQKLGTVGAFDWHFEGCPHCGGGLAGIRTRHGQTLHSVVWTGKEGAAGLYYVASSDRGKSWSPPFVVGDGHSRESDIAATSRAVAIVYSALGMNGETPIRFRRLADGENAWSDPGTLSKPGVDADHPRIVATPKGLLAFWTEARAEGGKVWAIRFIE